MNAVIFIVHHLTKQMLMYEKNDFDCVFETRCTIGHNSHLISISK